MRIFMVKIFIIIVSGGNKMKISDSKNLKYNQNNYSIYYAETQFYAEQSTIFVVGENVWEK